LRFPTRGGATSTSASGLIDDLELQIARLTVQLKRMGADHRSIPLLVTAPGFGWINAFTVASEIGDIERFASPAKLCGSTGLCPRVMQSGTTDRRGPLSKHGPRYLRWGLFEAAMNACKHPLDKDRYQHTKQRLGRQRGPKVAHIDPSRRLTEAIRHMLTRNQPFAPAGAGLRLAARRLSSDMRRRNEPPIQPDPHAAGARETRAPLTTTTTPAHPNHPPPTHVTTRPHS
jgi:hypothetical protein